MDCGYIEQDKYAVRIAGKNKGLLGSAILYVPGEGEYAYVLTAAHLFWNQKSPEPPEREMHLIITYSCDRDRITERDVHISKAGEKISDNLNNKDGVLLIHDKYNLRDKQSRWDAAVLRIPTEDWMRERVKPFIFPAGRRNVRLEGWGFPLRMAGKESMDTGSRDYLRESMPVLGKIIQYDTEYCEIKIKHDKDRYEIDLDGYSGTGFFADTDLFYGIFSRDAGGMNVGQYAWVTEWTVFLNLLREFGCDERHLNREKPKQAPVRLGEQAWWLLESPFSEKYGFMHDRYSINLLSLLLGMSDSYMVVLASLWDSGIGESLEAVVNGYLYKSAQKESGFFLQWKEYKEELPGTDQGNDRCDGIVVNIHADTNNKYLLGGKVKDILYQKTIDQAEYKLILNIWSDEPITAIRAVRRIQEECENQEDIDFLSVISYQMMSHSGGDTAYDLHSHIDRIQGLPFDNAAKEMLHYKDGNTEVWWNMLSHMAKSGDEENALLGYLSAKTYHPAVQRWLKALFREWYKNMPDILGKVNPEDIDTLTWEVYLCSRNGGSDEETKWKEFLNALKELCSSSMFNLLEGLEDGNLADYLKKDSVNPLDVVRWARVGNAEEIRQLIPLLKEKRPYYWGLITNSIGGEQFILEEVIKNKSKYAEGVLNQTVKGNIDIYQEEDTRYTRSLIRVEKGRDK